MSVKEKYEYVYKDDLFYPLDGRKFYQITSVCMSEMFGSFFVMLLGCSSWLAILPAVGIVALPQFMGLNSALAWGLAYGALYVCMAQISGLFLNPALAVLMMLLGEMSVYRMLLYTIFELIGFICGNYILLGLDSELNKDFCLTTPPKGLSVWVAFFVETWGTFALGLLFCICHDVRTKNSFDFSPIKLGFSFVSLHLALHKYSGCSLNPARALGASIVSNNYDTVWVYIAGPIVGVCVAAFFYLFIFNASITEPGDENVADEEA